MYLHNVHCTYIYYIHLYYINISIFKKNKQKIEKKKKNYLPISDKYEMLINYKKLFGK